MTAFARLSCFLIFAVAYCRGDEKVVMKTNCSLDGAPHEGDVVLDKCTRRLLQSDTFTNVTIPDFNQTAGVLGFMFYVHITNATIAGLESVRRLGDNHIVAKQNEKMRIRVAMELDGLNISVIAKIKVLFVTMSIQVEVFIPAIQFIAEIEESGDRLRLTRFVLNKTKNFELRFRMLDARLKFLNAIKWPFEEYLNFLFNVVLRTQIRMNVNNKLQQLSQRPEGGCSNCTTLDNTVHNAALSFSMDPATLPASIASMVSRITGVNVINGTIFGLSKVRQSGNFVVRIDRCGAQVSVNLTLTNLTLTLRVKVNALFTSFEAVVSASIWAKIAVELFEKNGTLFLENLVLKTTQPLDVKVKGTRGFAALATSFLPTGVIAAGLSAGLESLARDAITNGLTKLQEFAGAE